MAEIKPWSVSDKSVAIHFTFNVLVPYLKGIFTSFFLRRFVKFSLNPFTEAFKINLTSSEISTFLLLQTISIIL